MLQILLAFSLQYILYFSIFIKMFENLIGKLYRAAISHLRFHRYNFWCAGAASSLL